MSTEPAPSTLTNDADFASRAFRPAAPARTARLDHLTSLRGVAACSVLAQHVVEQILHAGVSSPLAHALFGDHFNFGRFGVMLFFLISGYVIPYSLKASARRPLVSFAISRVFRLYPAYWVSAICATIALFLVHQPPHALRIAANLTMLQSFLGFEDLVGAYWTLALELVFYGVCAALFYLPIHRRNLLPGLLVGGFLLAGALKSVMNYDSSTPSGGNLYILGFMFLGYAFRAAHETKGTGMAVTAIAMVFAYKAFLLFVFPTASTLIWSEVVSDTLSICVFLVALKFAQPRAAALIWLGDISYSIYLFHGVVLIMTLHFVPLSGSSASAALFAALTIGATLLTAVFAHTLIERPSIALGRRYQT